MQYLAAEAESRMLSCFRSGVLCGLMLLQTVVFQHVHQRRLAGIVQPLVDTSQITLCQVS